MLFKCNFHVHTVISPCADITMTPEVFVEKLTKNFIDWIAITDHNTSRNINNFSKILTKNGIRVIPAIEVQSIEEAHILVYFEKINDAIKFGSMIESNLLINNYDPEKFGYQIEVNKDGEFDKIINNKYFGSSCNFSVEKIFTEAKKFNSLIVPAHIFRTFGLITQLGIPPKINFDAVEVKNEEEIILAKKLGYDKFIFGTDAHFPEQLSYPSCTLECQSRNFKEFKNCITNGKVNPIWQH